MYTRISRILGTLLFSTLLLTFVFGATIIPVQAADSAPVYLAFEKSDPDGNYVWNGTVSGDINGELQTVLLDFSASSKILHVEFDWIIKAGDQSFTARLYGILDTETGKVVMDGTIVDGWLQGAQVHEEGQLVDPAHSGFAGTIRIMPASAN
jgi:hypothetical protein